MKYLLLLILLSASTGTFADGNTTRQTLDEARRLYQQAVAGNHGWTATVRLLEQAESALADGRENEAADLAARARKTASASVEQMYREQDAWKKRVPTSEMAN